MSSVLCLSEKVVISLSLPTVFANIYHICQCSYGTELDKEHNLKKKNFFKVSQKLSQNLKDVNLWSVFILLMR